MATAAQLLEQATGNLAAQRWDDAIDQALLAAQREPSPQVTAQMSAICGAAMQSKGLHREAIDYFTQAIVARPDHSATLVGRGRSHVAIGALTLGHSDFTQALAIDPDNRSAALERGRAARAGGDAAAARADFERALLGEETRGPALYELALPVIASDPKQARFWLEEAADLGVGEAAALLKEHFALRTGKQHLHYARLLHRRDDRGGARVAYDQAIRVFKTPGDRRTATLEAAIVASELRDHEGAIAILDGLLEEREDAELRAWRGRCLFNLSRDDEAQTELEAATQQQPSLGIAHRFLAELHLVSDRPQAAIASFDAALAADPRDGRSYYFRAVAHGKMGDEARRKADLFAAERFGYAKAKSDRRSDFGLETGDDWYDSGLDALDQSDAMQAVECFTRAIAAFTKESHAPNDRADRFRIRSHSNRGICESMLNQLEEARDDLDVAVAAQPYFVDAWSNLGNVLGKLGEHAEAIAAHDRVIALAPQNPAGFYGRGRAHLARRDYEAAERDFDLAITLGYRNPRQQADAHYNRAQALRPLGRYAEARRELVTARDLAYPDLDRDIVLLDLEARHGVTVVAVDSSSKEHS